MKVATPRGGFHFHFWSRGLAIRCSAGKLAPGFDVRGNGGFAILPPSPGPNGKFYQLVTTNEVRDLPAQMEKMLLDLEQSRSSRKTMRTDGDKQKEGGRNNYLTSVGGVMRRQGMNANEIFEALRQINLSRCDPPLAESEVGQIATSVGRYEPGPPNAKIPPDPDGTEAAIPGRFPITDVSNAERLIKRFGDEIVYASDRDIWVAWNGITWTVDDTLGLARLMKKITRGIYLEASQEGDDELRGKLGKWAQKSESQRTQLLSIDAAKDLAEHRCFAERFDVDPLKFSFKNRTVSFKKGLTT
jgi:putative DNA primase/helicase